jgi:hypothetical protein
VRSRCQSIFFVRTDGQSTALAGSSGTTEDLEDLTATAADVETQTLFDKLLLAARLASAGADLDRFGEALHRRVITRLESNELDASAANNWLSALERFRLQLRAKVSSRVALERLMLELS